MHTEQKKWWSPQLRQDMELKIYGHAGKSALVFPSEGGTSNEYEAFGMVEVCQPWIDRGALRLFTIDSVDRQAWANHAAHPAERVRRHNEYERYVLGEVIPFIRSHTGRPQEKLLVTGCSMGAYQSANFFFRHPELCDVVLAQSGIYRLNLFIGEYMDEAVYHHAPLVYLPNLTDPWFLERYRESQIIVSVGQGNWEHPMLEETLWLRRILESKNIPAWVDVWGNDVAHDWPWWRNQLPYFLSSLEL